MLGTCMVPPEAGRTTPSMASIDSRQPNGKDVYMCIDASKTCLYMKFVTSASNRRVHHLPLQVSRPARVEAGEAGATLVVCAGDEAALDAVLAALPPPPPLDDYSRAHSSSEGVHVKSQHQGSRFHGTPVRLDDESPRKEAFNAASASGCHTAFALSSSHKTPRLCAAQLWLS